MKGILKDPREQTDKELVEDLEAIEEGQLEGLFAANDVSEKIKDYFRQYIEEINKECQRRGLEKKGIK